MIFFFGFLVIGFVPFVVVENGPNCRRLSRRQGVQHGAAAVTRASFVAAAAVLETFLPIVFSNSSLNN